MGMEVDRRVFLFLGAKLFFVSGLTVSSLSGCAPRNLGQESDGSTLKTTPPPERIVSRVSSLEELIRDLEGMSARIEELVEADVRAGIPEPVRVGFSSVSVDQADQVISQIKGMPPLNSQIKKHLDLLPPWREVGLRWWGWVEEDDSITVQPFIVLPFDSVMDKVEMFTPDGYSLYIDRFISPYMMVWKGGSSEEVSYQPAALQVFSVQQPVRDPRLPEGAQELYITGAWVLAADPLDPSKYSRLLEKLRNSEQGGSGASVSGRICLSWGEFQANVNLASLIYDQYRHLTFTGALIQDVFGLPLAEGKVQLPLEPLPGKNPDAFIVNLPPDPNSSLMRVAGWLAKMRSKTSGQGFKMCIA